MRRLTMAATTLGVLALMNLTAHASEPNSRVVQDPASRSTKVTWADMLEQPSVSVRPASRPKARAATATASEPATTPISEYDRRIAMCEMTHVAACVEWAQEALPDDPTNPRPARRAPTRAEIEATVREVVLELQLPTHAPRIGPDPSANEWNMAVVGHPLWLWTDAARTLSTSRDQYGMTFDLSARLESVDFAMGDGATVRCSTTTPYRAGVRPGTPSPTCGHVYATASLPRGSYTVRATSHWTVAWSGMGLAGTLPASFTASRAVPVGELQAVVTR